MSAGWPLVAVDGPYCPVPALIDWFPTLPNRWMAKFPLVHVTIIYPPSQGNGSSSGRASAWMEQGLSEFLTLWHHHGMQGGGGGPSPSLLSPSSADLNGSMLGNATVAPSPTWPSDWPYPQLVNAHFCSYGYTFILEAVTGYLLGLVSFLCFLALAYRTRRHTHRKALFFLLFAVGVVRGLFGHLGANRIAQVDRYLDMVNVLPWFFDYTIPLNMLGDLLTSYVDFLLTFFWLQFVAPRWSKSHWGTFTPVACGVVTGLVCVVVFATDYHQIHSNNDFNGGNIYARSLAYISVLLLSSSALHSVVVVKLLRDLLVQQQFLESLSPKMRRNMLSVGVIGFLTVACGVMRGVVLLGHVGGSEAFLSGSFSFDDAAFTTVYFIGFMNIPCLVISVAFFILSWGLLSGVDDEGEGGGSDDGVYSVVSDGDSVRISFLRQYTKRMDSNITSSFTTSAGAISTEFGRDSSAANGSFGASTGSGVGGRHPYQGSSRAEGAVDTPSRRGPGSTAAMFAGSGGPSRSKRELLM